MNTECFHPSARLNQTKLRTSKKRRAKLSKWLLNWQRSWKSHWNQTGGSLLSYPTSKITPTMQWSQDGWLKRINGLIDNPQSVEHPAKQTSVEVWQVDPSHRVKQSQPDLPSDAPWSSSPGHTAHSSSTTPLRMALSCTMKSGTSLLPLTSDDHLVFDLITTESINISAHSLYISTSECGLDRRKRKYNDLPACDRAHTIRATH